MKTAIIDKEWSANLINDILEGPKYLSPRIELTELKFSKYFFKEPEIIKKFDVNEMKDYQHSLEKSCEYFLETIVKKKKF